MVGILDHVVASFELLLGEIRRMALVAGFYHLVAFALPVFLRQPRHVSGFHGFHQRGRSLPELC